MVLLLQKLRMDFAAWCLILKMKVRTIICCHSFTKICLEYFLAVLLYFFMENL